jgi:hypothetical protein
MNGYTRFEKLNHLLAFVAISCVIIFSMTVTWWLYFPYNVIDIETPIKILTPQVKQGSYAEMEITYSKNRDLPGRRQIQLENGMVVILDKEAMVSNLSVGKNITYRAGFKIPHNYPVGYCHATITISHDVNPMRTIVEKFSTAEFEVIK